jgi:outer membrane immunogenic protein
MKLHKVVLSAVGAFALAATATGAIAGGSLKDRDRPFSWSGFYVGLQGGYVNANVDAKSGPFPGAFDQTYDYSANGGVFGGHAGYNVQTGSIVFGVEGDIEASGLQKNGVGSLGYLHRMDVLWLGSVRGRIGVASGNWLFYGTGGWAWADTTLDKATSLTAAPFVSYSDTRSGWTAGGGVEHAVSSGLTVRLEYRYTDYGTETHNNAGVNSQDRSELTTHAVRAGASLKF